MSFYILKVKGSCSYGDHLLWSSEVNAVIAVQGMIMTE